MTKKKRGREKKEAEESAPVDGPFRRKFFSVRPALIFPKYNRDTSGKKRRNDDEQKEKKIGERSEKEKLSDRRNGVT